MALARAMTPRVADGFRANTRRERGGAIGRRE
jgi:hypothetical protein